MKKIELFVVSLLAVALFSSLGNAEPQQQKEHPLVPVLKIAEKGLKHIDAEVQDYSATLVKNERVR
ncbi:MAG: hypothetical protein OSA43_10205, partial [Pirellulales bacterium]|nr:hypothetical protein [Pirellulales bacterium]